MPRKKKPNAYDKIKNELENADHMRVEAYLRMLDRILIYNMAVNMMPDEALQGILALWGRVVKKSIDADANARTTFMEETQAGRAAKYREEPDGEFLRLHCLKQLELARKVAGTNLKSPKSKDSGFDGFLDLGEDD